MEQLLMEMDVGDEINNSEVNESENKALAELIEERRIEKVNQQPRSVKQMARNPQTLNFSVAVQRNLRWSEFQKSSLIESILLGYPIPPVYSLKSADKQLLLYDGKQRLTTLISYYNNEFELTELPELEAVYGIDVEGMKFSDLPFEFQELIGDTHISIYQFENLTEHQRSQLFVRLNSGVNLNSIELIRGILGTEMLEYINGLLENDFFKMVNMTENQVDKFIHQELALQTIGIITGELKDLSGKSVREFAQKLRDKGLTDEQRQTIGQVFLYLSNAFRGFDDKQLKKALKKNDIIAIVGSVLEAQVDPNTFGGSVMTFLLKPTQAYKETKRSGSAKESNITKRIDILKSILNG